MDAEAKLALVAENMRLEPAEETSPTPASPRSPHAKAACGHSPAELRAAVEADVLETLTKGRAEPGSALDAKKNSLGIYAAAMPGGKRLPMLKTLLTSACERDCYYCPFRAGRDYRRATFKPDEMATVFHQIFKGGLAQGLFLSSGIAGGGMRTQDKLINTAEILRRK